MSNRIFSDDFALMEGRVQEIKSSQNMEKEKGQKFNEGKLHYHTVLFKQFPKALKEVVKRSEAGHIKYKDTDQDFMNYKRVENGEQEYLEAAVRHMTEEGIDEDLLEYGETLHEAAVIWNLLANLELKLERGQNKSFRGGEAYKNKT